MRVVMSVAVGSCIQIALFVIPALIIIAWCLGKPLTLLFDPIETMVRVIPLSPSSALTRNIYRCVVLVLVCTISEVLSWRWEGALDEWCGSHGYVVPPSMQKNTHDGVCQVCMY